MIYLMIFYVNLHKPLKFHADHLPNSMSLCGHSNTITIRILHVALTYIYCVRTKRKVCSNSSGDTDGSMTMHQSLILMVRSVNRISIFGLFFNGAYSGCCCQRTFHRLFNARRRQKKNSVLAKR